MGSRRRNLNNGPSQKMPVLGATRSLTQQFLELERLRDEVRKAELKHEKILAGRERRGLLNDNEG
jgi:hypothetical protein